jgi:membrane protease YdiL (CAAX protease family)
MSNESSDDQPKPVQPRNAPQDFKRIPWGPLTAVVVTAVAFLVAQLLGGIAAALLPQLFGLSADRTNIWLDSVAGQFVFVLISEILTVGVLLLFLKGRKVKPADLGLGRGPRWRDILYVGGGFVVYFGMLIAAVSISGLLFHVDVNQEQEIGFTNVITSSDKLFALISLVVLPPIVEELLFRGFLYGGVRKRFGFGWAMLITSVVFAIPHLAASSHGPLWIAGIDTFVLSMVLCFVREKTGSLWAPMAIHALKNGLAFIFLFIVVS